MEFISQNIINTTTQIAVNSNTLSVQNIFSRNLDYQYYTDGFDNDATTASITVTFDGPTSISRIALLEKNFKEYRFFYDGLTANSFNFEGFSTSAFAADSAASVYFRCPTITCNSVTLEMKSTISPNQEKILGMLLYADYQFKLNPLPSAQNYKITRDPKQVEHKMSDGGTRLQRVAVKWGGSIKLQYISEAMKDNLESLWAQDDPFNFCPFGTATGWDVVLFESVWPGDFEFYEFTDNNTENHYSGTIRLAETPI